MVDLRVTTLTGREATLKEAAVNEFKASLRGQLTCPGDDGYDDARKVWNGIIDRRPALIARCAGVADVINAVNFAREQNLLVAVRGGGHNVAGTAVCDGGILIDLSRMKGVRVDPAKRTARAAAGLTWGELDYEAQAFGLATIGVDVSTVGIAGLTLGGGFGWLVRNYGLACDNLLSVDIVTAEGRSLTASATQNADLFWGVRGGGGNFGIITSFEYRLHPVGQLLAGMVLHPLANAKEVLKFYRYYTSTAPDELTAWAILLTAPDGVHTVAIFICYNGPSAAAQRAVQPLREFGPPLEDHIGPMSYREVQTMFDAAFPSGRQNDWKSSFLGELSDDAIDIMVARFATVPSPQSAVLIEHLGGAVSRVGEEETAFSHRDAQYSFVILSMWPGPAESAENIQWTDALWQAMQPFSSGGVYVNYLGEEGEDRVEAAYGRNYERLIALKNKYDPTNLFRHNQNIKPTVGQR
jgi:FAD/FMN-containing dehydrogenase